MNKTINDNQSHNYIGNLQELCVKKGNADVKYFEQDHDTTIDKKTTFKVEAIVVFNNQTFKAIGVSNSKKSSKK